MINPADPDFTNTPVSPRRARFGYEPVHLALPPAVSIITPFFNSGPVFHETARSIMGQSLQQWEWLIVNDGSTDPHSLSLLFPFRQGDPRIRVLDHGQNRGPSAARNSGFAAARADIVVLLDSDDLLEPTALEKWLWLLTSYPEYGFANGYSVRFGASHFAHLGGFSTPRAFFVANNVTVTCAMRKHVHQMVGGYDESMRSGLEDVDFWLHCATAGIWGATIPEHLDWYRQRECHGDRWEGMRNSERMRSIHYELRRRYARLWQENRFPQLQIVPHHPYAAIPESMPCLNLLQKAKPRLLMIKDGIESEAEWTQATLETLVREGWEVTIVGHDGNESDLARITQLTPDAFVLSHFLRLVDYPRFLRYLHCSRQTDIVAISASELGYLLLPYLRSCCPQARFVALCRAMARGDGRFLRLTAEYSPLLDGIIVFGEQARRSLAEQGLDQERIIACDEEGTPADGGQDVVSCLQGLRNHPAWPETANLPPELGQVYAMQAVECLRLRLTPHPPPTAGQEQGVACEQIGEVLGLLRQSFRSLLDRVVIWGTLPDERFALPLRVIKRLIPTSVKIALKRRVR